jgi:cyclohexyl-isocyanide hydratase
MSSEPDGPCIGFPIYPQATLLDFAGATQVFSYAGMRPIWIAERKGPVLTSEGVSIVADYSFDDHPHIDILFVPGGLGEGVAFAMFDPAYQAFLKKVASRATWSGGVCVGTFILAAAGLLDGCEATTYWSQIPNLELLQETRKITVAPGFPRSVIDLKNKRFTGGGISSSIDLALELVELIDGIWTMELAQLRIQYAPDPPIAAGDPTQAPPEVTERVRTEQVSLLTEPIRRAIERLPGAP